MAGCQQCLVADVATRPSCVAGPPLELAPYPLEAEGARPHALTCNLLLLLSRRLARCLALLRQLLPLCCPLLFL